MGREVYLKERSRRQPPFHKGFSRSNEAEPDKTELWILAFRTQSIAAAEPHQGLERQSGGRLLSVVSELPPEAA